jgi:hypothetical protein
MGQIRRHHEWLERLVQPQVLFVGDAAGVGERARNGNEDQRKRADGAETRAARTLTEPLRSPQLHSLHLAD